MGYITKTEAVNQMLLASGESIVSDLTEDGSVDTSICEKILDNIALEWQLRGIAENTLESYYLPMDTPGEPEKDDKIFLKTTTIAAELLSQHMTSGAGLSITQRPQQRIVGIIKNIGTGDSYQPILYNITEDTDTWDSPEGGRKYRVLEKLKLEWEQLSTVNQQGIADQSCRQYQIYTQGDANVDKALAERAQYGRLKARAGDIAQKNRNIFSGGDLSVRRARDRFQWGYGTNVRTWNQS